ncbi:MAG: H-NS histone family protein [Candidatus Marinimicrobia bacterium]|mgnify:FL=1|jgi:DNA-binding protein H-NS|nr:H-NS histone family protein [Candidatus Neomarinimicrobiota bacterium]MBT6217915.1 H-NS histone family protein [Candidatus Neomarinimicrobiota bacterium]MBT7577610.1 H-NS histone family protein [Candidatus Neomarinimicrobiota bacterium]MBT7831092.1 H-NS histone family protein [Candidatus Neomarinimicrobiota bacterium]
MVGRLDLRSANDTDVDKEIERLQKEKDKRAEKNASTIAVKQQIEELLNDNNLKLEQVFSDKFKKKSTSTKSSTSRKDDPSTHRWRNPNDHNETFHGIGAKSKRLQELIAEHGEEACKILENW